MFAKILLVSLALVQFVWAQPTANEDLCRVKAVVSSSEEEYEVPGLAEALNEYIKGAKALNGLLLKDEAILNSKSPKVLEFKQKLNKFEEDYAKCNGEDDLTTLADSFSNNISFYFNNDEATLNEDDKLVKTLLQKYKADEWVKESETKLTVLLGNLFKQIENVFEEVSKQLKKIGEKSS